MKIYPIQQSQIVVVIWITCSKFHTDLCWFFPPISSIVLYMLLPITQCSIMEINVITQNSLDTLMSSALKLLRKGSCPKEQAESYVQLFHYRNRILQKKSSPKSFKCLHSIATSPFLQQAVLLLNKIEVSMATCHFLHLLNISHRTHGQMRAEITASTANLNACKVLCIILLGYSSKRLWKTMSNFFFTLTKRARPAIRNILPLDYRAILTQKHLLTKVKVCFSSNTTCCLGNSPLISSLQAESKKDVYVLCGNWRKKSPSAHQEK